MNKKSILAGNIENNNFVCQQKDKEKVKIILSAFNILPYMICILEYKHAHTWK